MTTITGIREELPAHSDHVRELKSMERQIASWLLPGDSWRYRHGWPELEDMMTALHRIIDPGLGTSPRNAIKMEVHWRVEDVEVGFPDVADEWQSGGSIQEAVFILLSDWLGRICPQCQIWDGHGRGCPESGKTAAEEAWDERGQWEHHHG